MGGLRRSVRVTGGILGDPWESPGWVFGGFWQNLGKSPGAPKTKSVLGERPGMVLGSPREVFGRIGRSLGQS